MKTLLILFAALKISYSSHAQVAFEGTYSIAAICKDGIVVSTDSRGSYIKNGVVIAYFDGVQKAFIVKNCSISIIKYIAFGEQFVSKYVSDFAKTITTDLHPRDLLELFVRYLYSFPEIRDDLQEVNFIVSGYYRKVPSICAYIFGNSSMICKDSSGIAMQDPKINFGPGTVYDQNYCLSHSCKEIADIQEKAIQGYSENHVSKVGGKISSIKITPNSISFIKNSPDKPKWETLKDFFKDYTNNKFKMVYLTNNAKFF